MPGRKWNGVEWDGGGEGFWLKLISGLLMEQWEKDGMNQNGIPDTRNMKSILCV